MSNKNWDAVTPLDKTIRTTAKCGMTVGTVMVIEFISGFELFNTRAYHNYETWSQGYRVHGLGVHVEREDLDDAINEWSAQVNDLRAGKEIPLGHRLDKFPYSTRPVLDDWIEAGKDK